METTAAAALIRMSDLIDAQDWAALAAVLAPGFRARYLHTGEELDGDTFVALNRDYPGSWRFQRELVIDGGTSAVLRARVTDATGASDETHYVASFATVDGAGLLLTLDEVWAEVAAPDDARRPEATVGGQS